MDSTDREPFQIKSSYTRALWKILLDALNQLFSGLIVVAPL